MRKPADVVLGRPIGNVGDEHVVGDAQGAPHQLRKSRRTIDDDLIVSSIRRADDLAHPILHVVERVADLVEAGLLGDHQQRLLVVEVVGARDDVERGRLAIGESHVADPLRNIGLAADRLVVDDLREERRGGAVGLARRTPALMAHHDDRRARLRVEVDNEDFLPSPHGQAVGQHHRYGGFADPAPAIGDGDEFCHKRAPPR